MFLRNSGTTAVIHLYFYTRKLYLKLLNKTGFGLTRYDLDLIPRTRSAMVISAMKFMFSSVLLVSEKKTIHSLKRMIELHSC